LSRGFGPAGCPSEPLVSYQLNRQLAGWNLPPLVNRALRAHAKLKQFRAIATRYDKTARNFLAGIYIASAAIWLN